MDGVPLVYEALHFIVLIGENTGESLIEENEEEEEEEEWVSEGSYPSLLLLL